MDNTLGIIAGSGSLPHAVIENASAYQKFCIISVSNKNSTSNFVKDNTNIKFYSISAGKIQKIISVFQEHNVKKIVVCGYIEKEDIENIQYDSNDSQLYELGVRELSGNDQNIFNLIIQKFTEFHITISSISDIAPKLLEYKYSNTQIPKDLLHAIEKGQNFLNDISKYDVSQSIIMYQNKIAFIEDISGTDEMIKRVSNIEYRQRTILYGKPLFIKMAKANQTALFDVPTIGISTIIELHKVGINDIALQKNQVIILDQDEIANYTKKHNMSIYLF